MEEEKSASSSAVGGGVFLSLLSPAQPFSPPLFSFIAFFVLPLKKDHAHFFYSLPQKFLILVEFRDCTSPGLIGRQTRAIPFHFNLCVRYRLFEGENYHYPVNLVRLSNITRGEKRFGKSRKVRGGIASIKQLHYFLRKRELRSTSTFDSCHQRVLNPRLDFVSNK